MEGKQTKQSGRGVEMKYKKEMITRTIAIKNDF